MAQRKILYISADGVPLEHSTTLDEVTMKGFTAQDYFEVVDPSVGWLNQTVSDLIFDNILGKDRSNSMALASDILFGAVGDVAAQVDSFKVPHMAAIPTATPAANSNPGFLAAYNGSLYMWDGAAWNDLGVSDSANQVSNLYTADETLLAVDALYISAADNVSKALGDSTSKSNLIGFAKDAAADTTPVNVVSEGVLGGFSGLTAGSRYYLSATAAGTITSSIPTGTGNTIVQAGVAKNATTLHISIEQLGRRA